MKRVLEIAFEEDGEGTQEKPQKKKEGRSKVDDKFFSLSDMNSFLDKMDEDVGEGDGVVDQVAVSSFFLPAVFGQPPPLSPDSSPRLFQQLPFQEESGASTSYKYSDFFDAVDEEEEPKKKEKDEKKNKRKKKTDEEEEKPKKKKKKAKKTVDEEEEEHPAQKTVHFDVLDEDEEIEEEEGVSGPVLLGEVDEEKESESSLKKRIKQVGRATKNSD